MNAIDNSTNRLNWKHPFLILIGTILVGAIGSGLWDVGIKPSLVWFYQITLDIITFGSVAAKDSAYRAAALDQTAAPAARLYVVVITFLLAPVLFLLMEEFGLSPHRMRKALFSKSTTGNTETTSVNDRITRLEEITEPLNEFQRKSIVIRRTLLAFAGVLMGVVFFRHMIDNQSLLIWRSFNADLKQCAPYLTSTEEELLEAQFAAMQTKRDYSQIFEKFDTIAKSHKFTLHSTRLW